MTIAVGVTKLLQPLSTLTKAQCQNCEENEAIAPSYGGRKRCRRSDPEVLNIKMNKAKAPNNQNGYVEEPSSNYATESRTRERLQLRFQHEKNMSRMEDAKSSSTLSFATQNKDVLSKVLEYLDTESLLFGVAGVSKAFRQSIQYHQVVCSCMSTDRGHKIMDMIVSLIQKKCIYIPSPMRLLRLVIGKRCEQCNCTKTVVPNKLGLFMCRACTEFLVGDISTRTGCSRKQTETIQPKLKLNAGLAASVIDDGRFATLESKGKLRGYGGRSRWTMYAGKTPFLEHGSGEAVGPLLSLEHLTTELANPAMNPDNQSILDALYRSRNETDPRRGSAFRILEAYDTFEPATKLFYEHCGIVNHRGPFWHRGRYSMWEILVQWKNGERSWEPLRKFAIDDYESCVQYAEANNLLETKGWKSLHLCCLRRRRRRKGQALSPGSNKRSSNASSPVRRKR